MKIKDKIVVPVGYKVKNYRGNMYIKSNDKPNEKWRLLTKIKPKNANN